MKGLLRLAVFGPLALFATKGQAEPAAAKARPVVLVHGIMDTGNSFILMKHRLKKAGIDSYSPSLHPCDGRGGLENLAAQLKREIDSHYGPDQKITLIGFSMGGIISRYYLQELGGAKRCEMFMTLSSPHHGTQTAWLYPSKGAEQMRPGSDFLTHLAKTESRLGKMPVVSYHTPMDLMILPATSSVWDRAENITFPVIAHPLMLLSKSVSTDIERRLME